MARMTPSSRVRSSTLIATVPVSPSPPTSVSSATMISSTTSRMLNWYWICEMAVSNVKVLAPIMPARRMCIPTSSAMAAR